MPRFMNDRNLVRGLVLMGIALGFGLPALRYPIGDFSRAGAGLFPLMVCCLLLLVGLVTVVRSRFVEHVPLDFKLRNISVILASLSGFVVLSQVLDMAAGIAFMVFCSAYAGSSYSLARNVKVAVCLIGIAYGFQKLLGLNLPLF